MNFFLSLRLSKFGFGSLLSGLLLVPAIAVSPQVASAETRSSELPAASIEVKRKFHEAVVSVGEIERPAKQTSTKKGTDATEVPSVASNRLAQVTIPTIPDIQGDQNPDPDDDFGQPTPDVTPIDDEDDPALDPIDGADTGSDDREILGTVEPREDVETVFARDFEFIDLDGNPLDSSYLTPATIESQVGGLRERYFTIEELQEVADRITQFYLDGDYITSRAILPEQEVTEDIVLIQAIEGRLAEIEVEGEERLRESYIRSRIELGATTPLNTTALENQLRLLRSNPLFETVEASLRAGERLGENILIVRVTEARAFTASIRADNYAPPSVGSERIGIGIGHRNVAGFGDEFSAEYNFTTSDGLDFGNISYRVPINAMNGAVQFRASPNRNNITQAPFDEFDINGESSTYELTYRQPIVRSPREELAFSLGFSFQSSQTFIGDDPTPFGIGPDDEGRSRTRVLSFGQDYIRRDTSGAWAFRSQFRLGTDMFDATSNSGDTPDGQFLSWLGQIQRVQRLSDDHLLIAQLYTQFASDPLLPSQQFVIGGGQSIRGFRQNARSGDNGIRLSIEDRIALVRDTAGIPVLQLAPFLDLGYVWNDSDNPNTEVDQRFLAGLGLGVAWEPFENFTIRLDYGIPLVDLDDRGDNIQDDGFYFNVGYGF